MAYIEITIPIITDLKLIIPTVLVLLPILMVFVIVVIITSLQLLVVPPL